MLWNRSGKIARDRDLVHRMHDLAALDPEACGAARVVARDDVHSLPEQLADDEGLVAALDQVRERARRRDARCRLWTPPALPVVGMPRRRAE